ncbi:hypothetical protein ACIA5H_31375 [Nocardia sp. NPDC051900]|uniref:hypothetical protein n=1 Tax=Nocardia sp. NPDC051900 TaxID=3364326 RepID=UPI0037BBA8D8
MACDRLAVPDDWDRRVNSFWRPEPGEVVYTIGTAQAEAPGTAVVLDSALAHFL